MRDETRLVASAADAIRKIVHAVLTVIPPEHRRGAALGLMGAIMGEAAEVAEKNAFDNRKAFGLAMVGDLKRVISTTTPEGADEAVEAIKAMTQTDQVVH